MKKSNATTPLINAIHSAIIPDVEKNEIEVINAAIEQIRIIAVNDPESIITPSGNGMFPIFHAIMTGRPEIVETLLTFPGSRITTTKDSGGKNVFDYVADLYLATKQDDEKAASENIIKIIKLLVNKHIDMTLANIINPDTIEALLVYITRINGKNIIELMGILIDSGANVNGADQQLVSPMDEAIRIHDFQKAEFLITRGANIEDVNLLLDRAVRDDKKPTDELVKFLLGKGADINHQDALGMTALHRAVRNNDYKWAKILIENGADVNLSMSSLPLSDTPLSFAIKNGDSQELIKLLLDHGANPDRKVHYQRHSVLQLAFDNGNYDAIGLLVLNGADVSSREAMRYVEVFSPLREAILKLQKSIDSVGTLKDKISVRMHYGHPKLVAKNPDQNLLELLETAAAQSKSPSVASVLLSKAIRPSAGEGKGNKIIIDEEFGAIFKSLPPKPSVANQVYNAVFGGNSNSMRGGKT